MPQPLTATPILDTFKRQLGIVFTAVMKIAPWLKLQQPNKPEEKPETKLTDSTSSKTKNN